MREIEFKAQPEAPIDVAAHRPLLDNVRLWDTRAFHDTVTQIQALRPYYVFADTDVDRYTIDGQYRQVLLTPRELDLRQLPAARANWINPAFIYTHGYGVVLAPVSQITPDGLPVLLIENAPPEVKTPIAEADAAGDLLRRGFARAGLCGYHARRVQLSERRKQRVARGMRARAGSRFPDSACGWRRRFARASPTFCSRVI